MAYLSCDVPRDFPPARTPLLRFEREKSNSRRYLRPGQAAQMTSAYEKQRNRNIASNQRKLDALGSLHALNLLAPFEKVTQTSFAKKSKRNVSERDDDEYRLGEFDDLLSSSSSDNDNNVPSNPQIKKVVYNGPTRKSSRLVPTPEENTKNTTEGSNNLQLHVLGPIGSLASGAGSSKKNTWGKTRGKAVEKMVQKRGKLQVPIPTKEMAPVGENVTPLANQIGVEIRAAAPLQDVMYWDNIEDSLKKSIILRVRDKFESKNYYEDELVRQAIKKICQLRYKDWRSRMHAYYKGLLKNGENPKSKSYKGVSQEDWEYMIDQPDAIPMSQEEMLVAVLGKKSGNLRGYGVGRKPYNTNSTSRKSGGEVIILREELSSLKELNKTQQNQLVIQQQQLEAQNEQLTIQ